MEVNPQTKRRQARAALGRKVTQHLDETLVSLFEAVVEQQPDAIAVSHGERQLSYAQLKDRSSKVANWISKHTENRRQPIGLMTKRNPLMIEGMLGILMSGNAYVPIDPESPMERIAFVLNDTNTKLVLTDSIPLINGASSNAIFQISITDVLSETTDKRNVVLDNVLPSDPAYIIYTSGSTGAPKGVVVNHVGVVNHMAWMKSLFSFGQDDIVLQKTTHVFDVSVWEIFLSLCYGGRLVICDQPVAYNPDALLKIIAAESITTIHFVPTMYQSFLSTIDSADGHLLVGLKQVIAGGEALSASSVKRHYALCKAPLYNLYGPTEVSITATYYHAAPSDDTVPIGQPLWNTSLYLFDNSMQPVDQGQLGELYIGGVGVASGYLNRPELTSGRFIQNPQGKGILYRTGDICQWKNSSLMFLGRNDSQVKIRGYRVELGEIEHALESHHAIQHCAVFMETDDQDDKSLIAYIQLKPDTMIATIKQHLEAKLPEYMIPHRFYSVASFPLTASGKTDRLALRKHKAILIENSEEVTPPNTSEELLLCKIVQKVLKLTAVGINQNFFSLGGHSLLAIKISNEMRRQGYEIAVEDVFEYPTLSDLAKQMKSTPESNSTMITASEEQSHYPPTERQRALYENLVKTLSYSMTDAFIVRKLNSALFFQALGIMLQRYEVLRSVFFKINGEVRLKILCPEQVSNQFLLISLKNEPDPEKKALSLLDDISILNSPIDMEILAYKIVLFELDEDRHLFGMMTHHVVFDETSQKIFYRELLTAYHQLQHGATPIADALPLQYKDYCRWLVEKKSAGDFAKNKEYWLNKFETPVTPLALPYQPADKKGPGRSINLDFPQGAIYELQHFSVNNQLSLNISLMACVYILLAHQAKSNDICIVIPAAGRTAAEFADQLGLYSNVLPLRVQFSQDATLLDVVYEVKRTLLGALANQYFPVENLIASGRFARKDAKVAVIFEDVGIGTDEMTMSDLEITDLKIQKNAGELDMVFVFDFATGASRIEYDSALFSTTIAETFVKGFNQIHWHLVNDPGSKMTSLNLTTK